MSKHTGSPLASSILDAAAKGIAQECDNLRTLGIPVYGLDSQGNVMQEEKPMNNHHVSPESITRLRLVIIEALPKHYNDIVKMTDSEVLTFVSEFLEHERLAGHLEGNEHY